MRRAFCRPFVIQALAFQIAIIPTSVFAIDLDTVTTTFDLLAPSTTSTSYAVGSLTTTSSSDVPSSSSVSADYTIPIDITIPITTPLATSTSLSPYFTSNTYPDWISITTTSNGKTLTTSSPQGLITSIGSNTCAFFSSSPYSALTCGQASTCTTLGNFRGCCLGSDCQQRTQFFSACYDASISADDSMGILNCATIPNYPWCVTYLWSTSASPGKTITQFNCDTKQHHGERWLLPGYPGGADTMTTSGLLASGTASSALAGDTYTGAMPTGEADKSASVDAGLRKGLIVAAVMGGVAVLGLICMGGWLVRQNRRIVLCSESSRGTHHELPTDEC